MVTEIRTEKESDWDFFSDRTKDVIYEDGHKVGEIRHEPAGFFDQTPVDRTYDNRGNVVAETRHERDTDPSGLIDLGPIDRTYDTHYNLIAETRNEPGSKFFGDPRRADVIRRDGEELGRITREEDFLTGKYRVMTNARGHDVDPLTRTERTREQDLEDRTQGNSSSYDYGTSDYGSSYSRSVETPGQDKVSAGLIGITLFLVSFVAIAGMISEMSFRNYTPNNTRTKIEEKRKKTPKERYEKLQGALESVRRNSVEVERKVYAIEHSDSTQRILETVERAKRRLDELERRVMPVQRYEKPIAEDAGNTRGNAAETTRYKIPEQNKGIGRTTEETRSNMSIEDAFTAIQPKSDYARATPRGYAPVVRETRDANGTVSTIVDRLSKKEMGESRTKEIGFTYPNTGRRYTIDRLKYAEFYKLIDRDKDGEISLYEMSKVWKRFSDITAKYPEGDIDSIVREFVRKSRNKFGPFR